MSTAADPVLRVQGLAKRFGNVQALSGVDLSIGANELLVVLGPTGSGKTTLLRSIAGLEQPDAGTIHLGGADATRSSPADRDVALVFQNFSLYPDWSVRRNLEFPLRAPGRALDDAAIAARVTEVAELLAITPFLDRPAQRLSGGQMQRVALGRALVRRPRLFLLDEPLTNLDAKLRERLRIEITALRRRLGVPMLYVTHDQAEALAMADRVAVLLGGRIVQQGTPQQIYTAPISPAVARQVGNPPINLMDARGEGRTWMRDGVALCARAENAPSAATLGIRPEHITLAAHDAGPATVALVEHAGPIQIVAFDWLGKRWHAIAPPDQPLRVQQRVEPRIDAAQVVVWGQG